MTFATGFLRVALPTVYLALAASCSTEPESDRLVVTITDEYGRGLEGARLEVSSSGAGQQVFVADRTGRIVVDHGATDWSLEVRNVDGCPVVVRAPRRGGGEARWWIVSPRSLRRKCRETSTYGIRGLPGERVGWRQVLDREEVEAGSTWSTTLEDTTTLDALGRGILRIPVLLSPFRESSEFRILVRGVAFPLGSWWIDPTDSVFTILPIRVGIAVPPFAALSRGLVTDRDSVTVSWDSRRPVLEWRHRGNSAARRADVSASDTILRGAWQDAPADSFRWIFRGLAYSDDGVVLDTGTGVDRGLWLRPPP